VNLASLGLGILILTGCGLGKMIKKYPEVSYTLTPRVLEVHGGKVPVNIKGSFPAKYFHKKATATFTPVLKFEGGEVSLKPMTLIGEAAEGEGQKISYVSGGGFSYVDTIEYKDAYKKSELSAKVSAAMGSKTADFDTRKLGDGCITTSNRVTRDEDIRYGADKYEKETIISQKAEIYYPIQSSAIPQRSMRSKSIKELQAFIKNKYKTQGISITAWASPDGPVDLNDKLSAERTNSAYKYVRRQLQRMRLEGANDESLYNRMSKGEYWDGFNKLVGISDIEDKKLILDIVNRHSDVKKREQEIKNLAVVYLTLAKDILPKLRKAELIVSSYEPKKTDAEIDTLAYSDPDTLDVEELFYAASLTEDAGNKMKVYSSAAEIHSNDWRGQNNIGCLELEGGNMDNAKTAFEASKAKEASAEVLSNLGVHSSWTGNLEAAKTNYEDSRSAGGDVGNNMGILLLKSGDYDAALESFGANCSYNIALTNLLTNDLDKAKAQCDCAEQNAATAYLKAVVGARMGDVGMLQEGLKSAIQMDVSYRREAMEDLEFAKYWEAAEFKSAIQ
jgi:Tfp pilus assembly protein PilF/outer membrane protein OmpA-like peptidoglycan-associated protein